MKKAAIFLILTLTSFAGKVMADQPQGSLSANGPFCGFGTGRLTWTASDGTGPFTVIYKENGGDDITVTGVVSGTPFGVHTNPVTSNTTYTLQSVKDKDNHTRSGSFTGGSTTITVYPLPVVTYSIEPSGSYCAGVDITYETQAAQTNYVWVFPGTLNIDYTITSGGTATDRNVTLKYLTSGSKTVSVNYTDANSCTAASPASSSPVTILIPQGSLTSNGPFCGSGSGQLTWTATEGTGPYSIIYKENGGSDHTQSGVLSGTPFSPFTNPVSGTTTYTLVSVTDEATTCMRTSGFSVSSATITVNILPSDALTIGGSATLCSGSGTNITVASSESGVNYQLRTSPGNSAVGSPVAGNGSVINLPTGNLSATTAFNVLATNATFSCSVQLTGTALVTVNPMPQGSLTANGPFCNSGAGKLIWTSSEGTGPYTIIYNDGAGDHTRSGVSSGIAFNVFTTPVTTSTTYNLVSVTDESTSCIRTTGFTGSSATITINPLPVVTFSTQPGAGPVCVDNGVTYSTQAGMSSYAWSFPGILNSDYTIISGGSGTDRSVVLKYLTGGSKTVTVNYTNSNGCTAGSPTSSTATTVNTLPLYGLTVGGSTSICSGTETNITVSLSEQGVNYQLRNNTGNINVGIPVAGNGGTINLPTGNLSATTTFNILANNATSGCSAQLTGTATVNVYPLPSVTNSPTASTCNGMSPNISLTASTSSNFVWTIGTITGGITGASAGSGGTINQLLTNSGNTPATVQYLVTPTSTTGSCPGSPYTITVTVNPSPTLTLVSQAAKVCDGSAATINLLGLLPGSTSTVAYSINGIAQTAVTNVGPANGSGASSFPTIPLVAANNGQYLRVTGITTTSTSPNCAMSFTFDAPMSVDPATVAGSISSAQTICYGTTPADLNLSGNTGTVIKWQKSLDLGFTSPTNISVTTTTLPGATIANLYINTYFEAVVQSGVCNQLNTPPLLVTIKPLPNPTITGPAPVNIGTAGKIYNTETGKSSYAWTISGIGNSITSGSGTESITVTWNTPGDQTISLNYVDNGCSAANPASKTVHVNARPAASNITILGDPRSGLTLNTFYNYTDADSDPEGTSTFQWYTATDVTGTGSVPIPSATTRTYKLKDSDTTKYIGFSVIPVAQTGATPGVISTTSSWTGPVINSAPAANLVAISGSKNVNGVLIGHYTYSDLENDLEFQSEFQWYSSTSLAGTYLPIAGEIYTTHLIGNNEQGMFFKFQVVPKAATGNRTGAGVVSTGYGPVNSQPYADSLTISGSATIGSTLTGSYKYHDIDGDLQGATSLRWLKTGTSGTIAISGATATSYTLTSADEGYTISFEVTPVSLTGIPNYGTPVTIAQSGPVLDPSLAVPVADQICISGIRKANEILTGKYNYTFYKSEGSSSYRWLRNNVPISGATGTTYTLTQADIDSGQEIVFEVTPKSSNYFPKIGATVRSNPLARIKLNQTTYSLADTAFVLVPNVTGGVFSGVGVSNGYFSPWNADTATRPPHLIKYLLNIVNTVTTCSEQASVDISVVAVNAYMVGLKSVYCYDDKPDTVFVENVPPLAINRTFKSTNPASIIRVLHQDTVIIDPGKKRPGIVRDTLTYYYRFNGSYFPITQTYATDSVGVAMIGGLNSEDTFCNSAEPVKLFPSPVGPGGELTGPTTTISGKYLLDPSLGMGDTSVVFKYTHSSTGCFTSITVPIHINPAPLVSFKPLSVCVSSAGDTIRFLNMTTSVDTVSTWLWEFFDAGGSTTNGLKDPGSPFKIAGDHKVTLTATTSKLCSAIKEMTIGIGFKPHADFYWKNECYHPNDSVMFFDTTSSTAAIWSRTWKFGDSPVVRVDDKKYPVYLMRDTGYLKVRLKVTTHYSNCDDSITRSIYIRPTIPLITADYFQDFENGKGGWVKDYDSANNWAFGKPERTTIKNAASGNSAWYTNFDVQNQSRYDSSSVISPCFDFTAIKRPMISIKLFKRFDFNRDGAVLQYKIGDSGGWVNVGTQDDGIKWYNSTLIKGKPGGDQMIGWTGQDNAWDDEASSHTLDELSGKKDVKFKIAYGSDGTGQANDGFAFDDIRIGARTRKVMLEHFTNLANAQSYIPDTTVAGLAKRMKTDIINIQYHTNFPGSDAFYNENPGDASARILFYGLSRTPYSLIDGGTMADYANIYDFKNTPANLSNDLLRRSMVTPSFAITLNDSISGNILTVKGQIKALNAITAENITLYLVVTENKKTVSGKDYFNVFRKFIPDAAGISLQKSWAKNEIYTLTDKTWNIENISKASAIEVIAFIQNNSTREIYQATSDLKQNISVGTDNPVIGDSYEFSLYPNPAADNLTIEFEKALNAETEIMIYDFKGTVVRTWKAHAGQEELFINSLRLQDGIYLVKIKSAGADRGYKKLIITHR